MTLGALVAAVLGTLAASGAVGYAGASRKAGVQDISESEFYTRLSGDAKELWDSLTESQRNAILSGAGGSNPYHVKDNSFDNMWGAAGDRYAWDVDALLADLEMASQMRNDYAALGDVPIREDYLNDAYAQVDATNAALLEGALEILNSAKDRYDADLGAATSEYNADLQDLRTQYGDLRRNMISQQYLQNAQLMDTLSSNLDRARRNALESGASAGIRIAENINTLLSVQNKQSATAMETANQLSQMLVQQQAESRSLRNMYNTRSDTIKDRYNTAQNAYYDRKSDLEFSRDERAAGIADSKYSAASDSYFAKQNQLDQKYSDNNLWKYSFLKPNSSMYSNN